MDSTALTLLLTKSSPATPLALYSGGVALFSRQGGAHGPVFTAAEFEIQLTDSSYKDLDFKERLGLLVTAE